MDLPTFHKCYSLTAENEELTLKYKKLTKKFKQLQSTLTQLQEELYQLRYDKDCCMKNHSEPIGSKKTVKLKAAQQSQIDDEDSYKRLLTLHNNLLKQYEKHSKSSISQSKKLKRFELDNEKLKTEVYNSNQQIEFLSKQIEDRNQKIVELSQMKIKKVDSQKSGTKLKVNQVIKEKNLLAKENQRLRDELKGLDDSFFEEIEDLKYALKQSAKLNTEYEKALRRICKQFGLDYGKALGISENDIKSATCRRSLKKEKSNL